MRKALLATALVAAVAAPAGAQGSANGSLQSAISQTIYNNLVRRGLAGRYAEVSQKMPQALYGLNENKPLNNWMTFVVRVGGNQGWFPLNFAYGYPRAVEPGECYGIHCEAKGDFDNGMVGYLECDELQFDLDADGKPMMPSLPLAPGQPQIRDEPQFYTTKDLSSDVHTASNPQAAALWWFHRQNIGKQKEQWMGAAWVSDPRPDFHATRPAYRDYVTGELKPYYDTTVSIYLNGFHWRNGGTSKPCPPETVAGGDFDFYSDSEAAGTGVSTNDQQDGCTFYAKNLALSASGYGYPDLVAVPWNHDSFQKVFQSNFMAAECRINPELIRLMADMVLRYTANQLVTNLTYEPILLADVGTGGIHPLGRSLLENPIDASETSVGSDQRGSGGAPDQGTPPANYDPPEAGTSTGYPTGNDGSPDIDMSHPDNATPEFEAPTMGTPDWLPGLPSFQFPRSAEGCPVFGFQALERSFVIDGHCGHIEANRSIIATVMLVMFSLIAFMVILRA